MRAHRRYRGIVPVGPGKLLPARTVWKQTPSAAFSFLLSPEGKKVPADAMELAERIVSKFSAGIGLTGPSFVAFTRTFAEPAKLHCFVQFICTMNAREWIETQSTFVREVMENLSTGVEDEALPPIFDEAMFWMLTKHAQEPKNAFALRECGFGVAMQTLISSAYEVVARMKRGGRASTQYDLISTRILLLHLFVASCWSTWREKICVLTFAMLEASTVRAAETRKEQSVSLHFDHLFEKVSREADVHDRWSAKVQPRRGRQALRYLKKQFRSRGFGDVTAAYVFFDCNCRNRVSLTDMSVGFRKLQIPDNAVDLRSVFALSRVPEGNTGMDEPQLSEMAFIRLFGSGQALQTKGTELLLLGKPFFQAVGEARSNQKRIIATVMANVDAAHAPPPPDDDDAASISSGESGPTVLLQSLHRFTPSWSVTPTPPHGSRSHGIHRGHPSTPPEHTPRSSSSSSRASFQRRLVPSSSSSSASRIARTASASQTCDSDPSVVVGEELERCSFCGGVHVLPNDQAPFSATDPPPHIDTAPNSKVFAVRAARLFESERSRREGDGRERRGTSTQGVARCLRMPDTPDRQTETAAESQPDTETERERERRRGRQTDRHAEREREALRSSACNHKHHARTPHPPPSKPLTPRSPGRQRIDHCGSRGAETDQTSPAPSGAGSPPSRPRTAGAGSNSFAEEGSADASAASLRKSARWMSGAAQQQQQQQQGPVDDAMEMLRLVLELDIGRRLLWGRALDRSSVRNFPRAERGKLRPSARDADIPREERCGVV